MNAGLILAGGSGKRLVGCSLPKQFIEIGGKLVISYSLQVFENCRDIDLICVVADDKWRPQIGDYLFAEPGISRQHSIYNGLRALKPHAPQCVVIHDAARPLVTDKDISQCIQAAAGYDGATPALPVNETIYRSFNGITIASTLNRDELFIGQTPECYDYNKYLSAHEQYADMLDIFHGSSEIAVNAGMKIGFARGNTDNFKITSNADLERFQARVERGWRL